MQLVETLRMSPICGSFRTDHLLHPGQLAGEWNQRAAGVSWPLSSSFSSAPLVLLKLRHLGPDAARFDQCSVSHLGAEGRRSGCCAGGGGRRREEVWVQCDLGLSEEDLKEGKPRP